MFLSASSVFPDCIRMEEGGSTGGSDVVEALEESRAAEVSICGQLLDKLIIDKQ